MNMLTSELTGEEIAKILANTNWKKFWQDVADESEPELEAYRIASAKSMANPHVFV